MLYTCSMIKHLLFVVTSILLLAGCNRGQQPAPVNKNPELEAFYKLRKLSSRYGEMPADSLRAETETLLKQSPNNAAGWAFYGRILYDLGEHENSLRAYLTAVEKHPRYTLGYAGAGTLYALLGKSDSASRYLQKALELGDSSAYTRLNLALLYVEQNNVPAGRQLADSALILADSSAWVYAGSSYVYSRAGEKPVSDSLYNVAVALGLPDSTGFAQVLQGKASIKDYVHEHVF